MEPQRDIEKLLRACARKRRSEPGATPELDPGTRRRLQAEVTRQYAEPEREGFWFLRFLGNCRPQLAAILGLVVVMVFGFTLLMPTLGTTKSRAEAASAMSNLRQIGVALTLYARDNANRLPASLAGIKEYLVSTNATIDPVQGKPFVYVGAGKQLNALSTDAPLAYSPEDRKGRFVLFADGSVRKLGSKEFKALADEQGLPVVPQ